MNLNPKATRGATANPVARALPRGNAVSGEAPAGMLGAVQPPTPSRERCPGAPSGATLSLAKRRPAC